MLQLFEEQFDIVNNICINLIFIRILEDLNRSDSDNKPTEIREITNDTDKESQNFENSGNLDEEVTIESLAASENNVSKSNKPDNPESPRTTVEMDVTQEKTPDLAGLLTWLRNDPPLSPERLANLCIEHSDFETALRVIQPSAKREGFATVPDVTWDNVGSLRDIREELQMAILVRTLLADRIRMILYKCGKCKIFPSCFFILFIIV